VPLFMMTVTGQGDASSSCRATCWARPRCRGRARATRTRFESSPIPTGASCRSRAAHRARRARLGQARAAPDAPGRALRAGAPQARSHDDPRAGRPRRRRPRRAPISAGGAERAPGGRRDLPAYVGGLAVPGGRPGRLQPRDRRLEHGRAHARRARRRRARDGARAAPARARPRASLRQGSQYVSLAFGQAARDAGIAVSMGSKGDCFDNAVAESFFATLKKELVHRHGWPTRRELAGEVFEYIEAFYNRQRRHSTLGYLSPAVREQHSRPATCWPRRFAARTLTEQDRGIGSKARACPSDRVHSTPPRGHQWRAACAFAPGCGRLR
jgi:transposase InsO family protein